MISTTDEKKERKGAGSERRRLVKTRSFLTLVGGKLTDIENIYFFYSIEALHVSFVDMISQGMARFSKT